MKIRELERGTKRSRSSFDLELIVPREVEDDLIPEIRRKWLATIARMWQVSDRTILDLCVFIPTDFLALSTWTSPAILILRVCICPA